ncbi:hypothetical protein KXW36_000237, partial [Aspergillus fumigatus]
KPTVAPGLKVNAFATGLDHPRWIEVLPNGDVLIAEATQVAGPPRTVFHYAMQATMRRAAALGVSANRITLLRDKDGRDVGDGEEGILWVRGHSNTPLYWNRPDKSAETIRDGGWIYTGDRFVRYADGFHFFRGRADDLIKISGQWVYPLEVELCLADHPDVRECAVFAAELADRRMTLKAVVVMNSRAADQGDTTKRLQDY